MSDTRSSRPHLPYIMLAAVCAIVPFIPALRSGFLNWEDTFLIVENPAVRSLSFLSVWEWLTSVSMGFYAPVVLATFALETVLGGTDPLIFHAANLFLHAINTFLAGVLIHHMFKDRLVIVVALLFFALHPLRVEPVMWISARTHLLSTLFILSTVLLFIRYQTTRTSRLLAVTILTAILASLSNAIAVVIPILLLIVHHTLPGKRRKDIQRLLLPFWVLALLTGIVAALAQYTSEGYVYDSDHTVLRTMTLPFWNTLFYVWKTLVPSGLSAVYPYPEHGGPDLLLPSILSLVLLSIIGITLLIRKPEKRIFLGIGWFLVCVAPVLQFFPVGHSFAADRYTYLPAIGLSILLAVAIERLLAHKKGVYRPLVRRAGIVILAVLGTVSYVRTDVWEKSLSLWTDVLTSYPLYAEGYVYLGSALATEERETELAIEAFTQSIRLDGSDPHAYRNRALALYQGGSADSSRIIADLTTAVTLDPGTIDHQLFLAEVYLTYDNPQRSLQMCSALLDADPTLHTVRLLRLRAAFVLGRTDIVNEDTSVLEKAGIEISIERDPGSGERF